MSSVDSPAALWVVPVPDFGGVARHVVDMARAGLPGFNLVVLAPTGKLTERLESMGVEVIHAEFGPDYGFKTSFATLDAAISEHKPALVHSHLAYADVVAAAVVNARAVRRVLNKGVWVPKLVTTEHGIAGNDTVYHKSSWRSKLMEQVHRVRLWGTDKAIAVSDSTAEQMGAKWGARNVTTVYNGVDIEEVRSAVEAQRTVPLDGAPRLLSLSRLSPEKGIDVLLEAFALLHADYPQAHLEIAGSGDLADELAAHAERLNLGDTVTFSGFVDPVAAMSRSNLLVQLSVWENCSYTLLDARSAGLKVVATAVGGNPEILEPVSLVNRDSKQLVQDVYHAMRTQLQSSASDSFTWISNEQMAAQTVALYTRLLAGGK
ncbi:MAG: glycosyltransferase [Rothia sp. (in: high G+C Gram-positive bacteria)]|uniref:glycosyltransferase n=1 Tax=Rothia sp. (in: high G+C Gram-positive bacteria) TaxID=1885016 RepID=UPI0026DF859A|nr:glycosyltransferase [Rothia sp. (in: high G+C Gram-positive bacteria)]MDO5750277.1 glycosyltransferase [Rothia sp. (in: high G+C Gram-positive bacteria)]